MNAATEQAVLHHAASAKRGALTRRAMVLAGAGALSTVALPGKALPRLQAVPAPQPDDCQALADFLLRFMTSDGRIIDTGNNGISHSEGQGVAMLAAAHFGGQDRFQQLWDWTRRTLAHGGDALHAWRYRPFTARAVDDPNNATDGDLLIAYALLVGADRWNQPAYRRAGLAIARDIGRLLVQRVGSRLVLLPGTSGFQHRDGTTINPSYYVLPALRRIAAELSDPVWNRLAADALAMLTAARFGQWQLPPDWLHVSSVGARLSPASQWPARFSFDAVRLPLYLCWAGHGAHPVAAASCRFWAQSGSPETPAWVDLVTNRAAPYAQSSGMRAIRSYVESAVQNRPDLCQVPAISAAQDYYAAALTLLVRIARAEGNLRMA